MSGEPSAALSPRRVLVIGSGGAGKSTVARAIAERLRLPLVHLDTLYWKPGWQSTEKSEWQRTVADLISAPAWVIDGNYSGTLDLRLEACDTVVFLDLPRLVCLWRLIKRQLSYRGRQRPDMAVGCPERLTWEFVVWVWTYRARRRAGILSRLSRLRGDQRAIVLSSDRMIRSYVEGLG